MDKATLKRIGQAAMSGMSDVEIERDSAAAFHLAQGAMRGALAAAVSVSASARIGGDAQMETKGERE
jgi:hypothetical protein